MIEIVYALKEHNKHCILTEIRKMPPNTFSLTFHLVPLDGLLDNIRLESK